MNRNEFIIDLMERIARASWWLNDWRDNPLIQRSRNPLLRTLAMQQIEYYVARGDTLEAMLKKNCGIMGHHGRVDTAKTSTATGGYLIPGNKKDEGVRCSSREIGALIEYSDGRVEYQVFTLAQIYAECKAALQPVHKPQQLRLAGF